MSRKNNDPLRKERHYNASRRQAISEAEGRRQPNARTRAAMDVFLEGIRLGKTVDAASAACGRQVDTIYKWGERYPDFDAEYKRARVKLAQGVRPVVPFDADFRQKYFHYATPWHLQAFMDEINDLSGGDWMLALFPPNHAKSTTLEDFITHLTAMDPNIRILIVSKSQGHAIKMLGRIKERMTNRGAFADFIDDYGPFKHDERDGKPWTQTHITVARKDSDERDYTIQAIGVKGQIYGTRCDLIVLDDIADTENQTAAEIDKQLEWIQLIVDSRLDPDHGKAIVVGTRIREDDIYGRLEEMDYFSRPTLKFPAIIREPGGEGEGDPGKVLWPERWPMEKLLKKRSKMDARIWELSYQQNPLPQTGAHFPLPAIESCYDDNRFISHVPSGTRVVVGIDPAVTGFTAGVVFAVNPKTKYRYLVDIWNEENIVGDGGDRQAGLIQFIVELCRKYHADTVCLEANSAFKLLADSLSLRSKLHESGVRLITRESGGHGDVENQAIRQLSGLFFDRMISIPTGGWSKGYAPVREMVRQFISWDPDDRKRKKDIVKAFQMCEYAAKHVIATNVKRKGVDPHLPPYLRKQRYVRVAS